MAKVSKVPTTGSERWQHLQEQMDFLRRSCSAFDEGYIAEAKRMANEVVKLVFNERHFRSVLHQVNLMPGMWFISTCVQDSVVAGPHLLVTRVDDDGARYEAPADKPQLQGFNPPRILTFADWWNEEVITVVGGSGIPRWKIVRSLRDEQGGGHVDPTVDETMAELRRGDLIGSTWTIRGRLQDKIPDIELHSMRQISHEVLISIERKLTRG